MPQTSLMHIGQGRFSNSVAVRARPVPASPSVLQMLAQSIASLSQKVDVLAQGINQLPQRQYVESREIVVRPTHLPSAEPVQVRSDPEPTEQPRVNRRSLWSFFD